MDGTAADTTAERRQTLVNQVTTFNSDFIGNLLKEKELAFSGTKQKLRERLLGYLETGELTEDDLLRFLGPLELWGNQVLRVVRMEPHLLTDLQTRDGIISKATSVGMGHLVDRDLPLEPGREMEMVSIRYRERDGKKLLVLIAARTRVFDRPDTERDERDDDQDPDVYWKPMRKERQKAVSFAEIDLQTGDTIISTRRSGYGKKIEPDFNGLMNMAKSLVLLEEGHTCPLCVACHKIPTHTAVTETRILSRNSRDPAGGELAAKSSGSMSDVRTHNQLNGTFATLGTNAAGNYCNVHWLPNGALVETVHTQVHGTTGEIVVFGQVTENSVRYVLQRIRSLN